MTNEATAPSERVERIDLRDGLTMIKRVTLKEDGRWLIYFDFEREPAADRAAAGEQP